MKFLGKNLYFLYRVSVVICPVTSCLTKCWSFNCSGQCHGTYAGCCGFSDQWLAGIV